LEDKYCENHATRTMTKSWHFNVGVQNQETCDDTGEVENQY